MLEQVVTRQLGRLVLEDSDRDPGFVVESVAVAVARDEWEFVVDPSRVVDPEAWPWLLVRIEWPNWAKERDLLLTDGDDFYFCHNSLVNANYRPGKVRLIFNERARQAIVDGVRAFLGA